MATLSIPALKSFAAANKGLVADLLKARAEAPVIKAKVEALVGPLFAAREFWSKEVVRSGKVIRESFRIEKEDNLYQADLDSPEVLEWNKVRNEAILAAFPGTPDGYDPALMADSKVVKLENALLKSAGEILDPAFGNIYNMTKRAEAVEFFIKAVKNLK